MRAVCFRGVSSANLATSPALASPWQLVQLKLREAAKKPIVFMNSSAGIPLSTWTFLNTSSAISGFVCALAETIAATQISACSVLRTIRFIIALRVIYR